MSRRRFAPVLLAAAPVALLFYAVAVEPYAIERHDLRVAIRGLPPVFEGYRILHLSDFEATAPGLREERVAGIAREARPDLVLVTGDLSRKALAGGRKWRAIRRMAAWLRSMDPPDGVWFVQGHGEMASRIDEGTLRRELDSAGIGSLWDEVRLIRRADAAIALAGVRVHDYGGEGSWTFESEGGGLVRQGPGVRPGYLELDAPGAAGWSGYEMEGRLRFSSPEDWAGPMVHCRLSSLEDRLYLVLRRSTRPWLGLSAHGTAYTTGRVATWRRLDEGRWHRFRVKVETDASEVRLKARSWPDGDPEPAAWDLEYADASDTRIPSGAPGLYAEGPGVKEFADLRVSFQDGRETAPGALRWREPAGSDLLVDLLSRVPSGAPVLLMSHTPDIFPDARELSIPLVMAGHTQGGQIRLPFLGALVTDTRLPRRYASGLFHEGGSTLFVNRGVGTSRIPLRFLSPPEAAVITLTRADAP